MQQLREDYLLLPNFLIIGAAKAGTTALYSFLNQHPNVFMSSIKEPRYFSFAGQKLDPHNPVHKNTVTELSAYLDLFKNAGDAIAIGEASPSYLHNPSAPRRIKEMIPHAKLIAILRNPTDRAFSHFMHFVKLNHETTTDFEVALKSIDALRSGGWYPRRNYLSFGFYGEQLSRYYDLFDKKQIKVYIFEEFKKAPLDTLNDMLTFLGVDNDHNIDTSLKINVSGVPINRKFQKWLKRHSVFRHFAGYLLPEKARRKIMNKLEIANLKRPEMDDETRQSLNDYYSNDIRKLEELLQRKIDVWLT
jgi:hypothetical protein